ncbi:flippase [Neptuniibacter sp. QD57_21]|uniref:flippase n=1 Tax=Neptuniibacter sp. QD57_21 TaxID=3398213 RepID=UPI0039F4C37D
MKNYKCGAIAMLIEKFIKMVSQLAILIMMANILGADKFGILMYALAIASIFIFLNNLGLDTLLVKKLVQQPTKQFSFLYHAWVLRTSGALISIILVNVIGLWLVSAEDRLLLFIISIYHLFIPINLIEWFFNVKGRSDFAAIGLIIGHVVGFLFRLIVLLSIENILWLAAAYSIELIVTGIVYFILIKRVRIKINHLKISKERGLRLVNEAKPLIISGALVLLYMKMDQIMLGYMIGSYEVAVYTAATRLSEAWFFVGITIITVFYPKFLESLENSGNEAYFQWIVNIGRIVVWGAVVLAITTMLMSEEIVELLYQDNYKDSASVLAISIWCVPFVYLGSMATKMLITDNKNNIILKRSFLGVIVNLILNLILIPQYGAVGAAVSTLISQMVSGFLFNFFGKSGFVFYIQLKIIMFLK